MGSFHLRHGRGVHSLQVRQAPPPRKHPVVPHPATAAGEGEGQKGGGSRRRGLTRWSSQLFGLAGHVAGGQLPTVVIQSTGALCEHVADRGVLVQQNGACLGQPRLHKKEKISAQVISITFLNESQDTLSLAILRVSSSTPC